MNDMRKFMSVLTEDAHIEEASLGALGKAKDAAMGKLGNQKAQGDNAARPAAEEMYKKWQQANKEAGNQLDNVPAMVKWLENNGIESDVLKAGFQGIGVQDVSAFSKEEEKEGILKWLDDEMIQPGALTGEVAKQFLVSQGVADERVDTMLDRIGVKADGGKIISNNQREKLDTIVQKFGSSGDEAGEEGDEETATDEKTVDAETPANEVYKHMLANYKTDEESMNAAFDHVGVDPASTEPMGDEAFDGLADLYGDADKKEGGTTDEPAAAADGEKPDGTWTISKVREYILTKYEIEPEELDGALGKAGADVTKLENPIGDEALSGVTDAIAGGNVPEKETGAEEGDETSQDPDTVMDKAQETMKSYGGSVGKAVQQGREAAKTGDVSGNTELQKLGIAILTARKKI